LRDPAEWGVAKISAGIILFRRAGGDQRGIEVLLVHPGGPFWARKDLEAWSIPKGEPDDGEDLLEAARREFEEETGGTATGRAWSLGSIKQPGGKTVHAWAVEGDFDPARLDSNTFTLEWPRESGRMREFPEVDRAEWFSVPEARRRILKGQLPLLDKVEEIVTDLGLKA
jgi:predicted NUDIX family NTP pyrophosphohydrolase